MKRTLSIVISAICLVISGPASGVSAQTMIKSPAPSDVDSSQATENRVFRGIVKKLDEGTALFTDKEIYPLVGGDFETIVGKEVNIIGKIVREGDIEKLQVTLVQFNKI